MRFFSSSQMILHTAVENHWCQQLMEVPFFLPVIGLSLKYEFVSSGVLLEKLTSLEINGKRLDVAMSK